MAFPVSPTEGQTYTENNTVWIYSAVMGQWNRSVINPLNETTYIGSDGAPGGVGSDTQVIFNNNGSLAGDADLAWDYTNKELEIGGDIQLDDGGSFTTTLQTVTPTANRTISFPNATGTVGLVAGSSGQLVYNNAGANAGVPSSVVGATGDITLTLNGAASTPPLDVTGTWFTGGTSTTTKPQVLIEPAGTTSTAWSTAGTGLGVNAASGFTGRLLDLQVNGTRRLSYDSQNDGLVVGAGIGSGQPQNTLHLAKEANHGIRLERTGSNAGTATINVNSFGALAVSADNAVTVSSAAAAHIALSTGATERARIDSSGRVGIGTTSPGAPLHVAGECVLGDNGTNGRLTVNTTTSTVGLFATTTGFGAYEDLELRGAATIFKRDGTNESARIDSSGDVLINTTASAAFFDGKLRIASPTTVTSFRCTGVAGAILQSLWHEATSGDNQFVSFGTETTRLTRGSISYNRAGGLVAYNTTSDYRAKTILGDIDNSGEAIDALKVYRGVMNGATVERPMLVAHEAQEVAPYCVTGEKDAVDDDGNPIYQQMDHQALVPLLIAEIQQLRNRVAALEGA